VGFPQELGLSLVRVEKGYGGMTDDIKAIAKLVSEQLKAALAQPQPASWCRPRPPSFESENSGVSSP